MSAFALKITGSHFQDINPENEATPEYVKCRSPKICVGSDMSAIWPLMLSTSSYRRLVATHRLPGIPGRAAAGSARQGQGSKLFRVFPCRRGGGTRPGPGRMSPEIPTGPGPKAAKTKGRDGQWPSHPVQYGLQGCMTGTVPLAPRLSRGLQGQAGMLTLK